MTFPTALAWSLLAGLVLCVLAFYFCRWLADGGDRLVPDPEQVAKSVRRYDRAVCEHCLREVAIRRDGRPILNRHRCHIPQPADTEESC